MAAPARTKRVPITLVSSKVTKVIPVIPIFFSTGDSTFWGNVETDGRDVVFTAADGTTVLSHYKLSFTHGGTTGTACFLVNVANVLSQTRDVTIYAWVGGASGATDPSDANAVFSGSGYAGVYFPGMGLNLVGGALTAVNSPGTEASAIEGITGATYTTNQYHHGTPAVTAWDISIEALAYTTDATAEQYVAAIGSSAGNNNMAGLRFRGNDFGDPASGFFRGNASTALQPNSTSGYTTSTLHHIACTYDGSNARAYIDGGNMGSAFTSLTALSGVNRFAIGVLYRSGLFGHLEGGVSAVFVSDEARDAAFMATHRNAWLDSGFHTLGATENAPSNIYTDWKEFTVAATSTPGDVDVTDPDNAKTNSGTFAYGDLGFEDELYRLLLDAADWSEVGGGEVTGVEVEVSVTGEDGSNQDIYDLEVSLINSGTVTGDNKADVATQIRDDNIEIIYYGGPVDKWGIGTINLDADFGVSLRYINQGTTSARVKIYKVRARATYLPEEIELEIKAVGAARVRTPFEIKTPGLHNMVASPFSIRCVGAKKYFNAYHTTTPGKHSLALIPVNLRMPGAAKLYRTYSPELVGAHTKRWAILLRAAGTARIQRSFEVRAQGAAQYGLGHTITLVGAAGVNLPIHTRVYRQGYRVADASYARWELYVGEGSMPDFDGVGQPVATGALPLSHTPTLPGPGLTTILYIIRRWRSQYNLLSHNMHPTLIEIDENGLEVLGPLTPPELERVLDGPSAGSLQAWANYPYEGDRYPADQWELYVEAGVDPDPSTDTPVLVAPMGAIGGANIVWRGSTTGLTPGINYHVRAVVRRLQDNGYAQSSVLEIDLAPVYDISADDVTAFGGEEYEAKQ